MVYHRPLHNSALAITGHARTTPERVAGTAGDETGKAHDHFSLKSSLTHRSKQEGRWEGRVFWNINYLSFLAYNIWFLTLIPNLYLCFLDAKWRFESLSLLISQLPRNPLGILQTLQTTPPKKLQRTSAVCLLRLPLLGEETALTILRIALGICSPEEKLKRTTYFPEFQNPKVSGPTTILSPMFTCKTWALFLLHKHMSSDYALQRF